MEFAVIRSLNIRSMYYGLEPRVGPWADGWSFSDFMVWQRRGIWWACCWVDSGESLKQVFFYFSDKEVHGSTWYISIFALPYRVICRQGGEGEGEGRDFLHDILCSRTCTLKLYYIGLIVSGSEFFGTLICYIYEGDTLSLCDSNWEWDDFIKFQS